MINKIGEARERLGYSQEQVARMTGIKRQLISDYELDKVRPGVVNLLKIARALKCHADEIMVLEEKDWKKKEKMKKKLLTFELEIIK